MREHGAACARARRWALALLLLLVSTVAVASRSEDSAFEFVASTRPPADLVLAGGLDGRVYAIHAWSGDVLWTFDSGGPMVDSSQCALSMNSRHFHDNAASSSQQQTVNVETPSRGEKKATKQPETRADGFIVAKPAVTVAEQAIAASTAFMERLVPSYDGRLYHFADNKVTELEMTMADIVSVNGPIRLAGGVAESRSLSDVLLVGEKRSELFVLDAANGLIRPFPTVPSTSGSSSSARPSTKWSTDILFGRSEYMTQALHARNASFTRCFRISEYFLQFAQQPHCSMGDVDGASRAYAPPEIIVIPKDPDASRARDEGSTIAGFDPWTNKQLWEFEVPDFDVLAVFGLSPSRGSTFYQWRVDGPSSSSSSAASSSRKLQDGDASTARASSTATYPSALPAAGDDKVEGDPEPSTAISKQLTRVMPSSWDAVESRFRLRMLEGDNYFLESSVGGSEDVSNLSDDDDVGPRSTFDDDADELHGGVAPTHRWKRRILWEPIENDGKRGVFITYYHAGAMMLMTLVGCVLIAWGCYVKGLSASIAQTAIKSMDQSQFFVSHVHQLTIERPGEENITISSVISRALLMDTTGSVERPLRLLGNGESEGAMTTSTAESVEVNVDPATEAMMMEKFSRMAATEAAALIAGGRYSKSRVSLRQLEYELDSKSSSTELSSTVVGDSSAASSMISSSFGPRLSATLALPYDEDAYDIARDDDCDLMEYEVKMLPAHGELLSSDSESDSPTARVVELLDSEDGSARDEDPDKSLASSWNSENTTGSCFSQTSKSSSRRVRNGAGDDSSESLGSTSSNSAAAAPIVNDSAATATQQRRTSDASSSLSSSSDDQTKHDDDQVFLPFVCQSRFLHEFEEISAIGKGGFGQVVLAENRLDGRKYAIKRVGLNLKNQTSKTLQKFLREVKILALLDHPNIVRYYQAWLEKVEESAIASSFPPSSAASSMNGDSGTFGAATRNYSMSNLLAPISEMSFSSGNQDRMNGYYDGDNSVLEEDDGGFEWERGSSDGNDANAWKEEDLVVQNKPPVSRRGIPSHVNGSGNANGSGGDDDDDSATSYSREKCDHLLYIQMQYCAGRNLGDYLAVPGRPMELSKLLKIFVQIASALAHVHSCGLIHRDLKPANIFVADTDGDSIKLGDFGLSRYAANVNLSSSVEDQLPAINRGAASAAAAAYAAMGSRSTWSNAASESNDVTAGVGTYLYASPEQVAGKKYNAKTDIYSLGMILFELCHERFATTMERYVTLRSARDCVLPEDFVWKRKCPELVDMMLRLLHRDPLARPTADEVVQWSQALYESNMDMVRSPRLGHGHHHVPLDHLALPSLSALASPTFTLQVEAADATAAGSGVPNHYLLKQVCDVIGCVHGGKVEIKKFGLHLEDEGAQILEFVLDAHAALAESGDALSERDVIASVLHAIQALDGVRGVRQTVD